MKISETTIQSIKEVSLLDIVGQYVDLKRHGSEWRGICPFHEERTPSFSVNPNKGYKCFGCDAGGGDAIAFIMALENKAFPDAVIRVAEMAGISIDQVECSIKTPRPIIKKQEFIPKPISFIPIDVLKNSLQNFEENKFIVFLNDVFGPEITQSLIDRYFIGSNDHWKGSTVFWQIDILGNIRTGKIMLYDPETGKRVKNLTPPVYWIHKEMKEIDFNIQQCLFGEHLLANNTKPVGIVESEKTAIIASVFYPDVIWVACGGLTSLKADKCMVLKGRKVILYPDLNGFEEWSNKANELNDLIPGTKFIVSELLNTIASDSEKNGKLDLADYLIKQKRDKYYENGRNACNEWLKENPDGGDFEFDGTNYCFEKTTNGFYIYAFVWGEND